MKEDVVNLTSQRIMLIINEKLEKTKGECIDYALENIFDECELPKLKLKLHIACKGTCTSQVVSDCLSLDDIGKIHDIMKEFAKQNKVNIS
ncbi:MAG: hypothetical protein ABSD42_14270 [Candidatus Bathyarchaeia archaeon]|jgi:hypothetical protein